MKYLCYSVQKSVLISYSSKKKTRLRYTVWSVISYGYQTWNLNLVKNTGSVPK